MPTMREAYERNVGTMDPDTMDTLFLDNVTTRGKVFGLAAKYSSLAMLSMMNCNLTTLDGLPYMPQLSYLDVSNNQLGDEAALEQLVQKAPVVEKISMSGNMLGLGHLVPLKDLPKLSELDLTNNVHLGLNYRAEVFALLPTLKILDGCDIDGVEMDEDDDEEEDDEDPGYHRQPPPPHRRNPPPHRAAPRGSPRAAPRTAHRAGVMHQVHAPVATRPRQVLVAPHRALAGAAGAGAHRQQVVRVVMPQDPMDAVHQGLHHDHVYLHDPEHDDVVEEEILVEEEVVVEGDEEEFVDVDGIEGDVTIGSDERGGGALHEFLDDSTFTYNEEGYYDPEDSISATIDDVIAAASSSSSSSAHYQHHQRHDHLNLPSTSSASTSTSSPRGTKRTAPSAAPPPPPSTRPMLVVPKASSSSGEEVDVEGLEPRAKRIADSIDAVARGALGGPSRGSDDDLNVD